MKPDDIPPPGAPPFLLPPELDALDTFSWSYLDLIGRRTEWTPKVNPRSVTASDNVNPLDDLILVDTASGAVTMTLETAVGADGRRHTFIKTNAGANAMTIAGTGSETMNGSASIASTAQYDIVKVVSDGTNWNVEGFGIKLSTEQATTSGTVVDFTVPVGTKRITMMFVGVSTNGTSIPMVQLGDAGGIETSGYSGNALTINTTPTITGSAMSAGFLLSGDSGAGVVLQGHVTLSLEDSSDNTWTFSSVLGRSDVSTVMRIAAGTKALSATLTQLRLTTVNGTDTFDAGAINVSFEG